MQSIELRGKSLSYTEYIRELQKIKLTTLQNLKLPIANRHQITMSYCKSIAQHFSALETIDLSNGIQIRQIPFVINSQRKLKMRVPTIEKQEIIIPPTPVDEAIPYGSPLMLTQDQLPASLRALRRTA